MNTQQQKLFLFVHLPKSAGTSLNKHFENRFSSEQKLTLSPEILGVGNDKIKDILSKTKHYLKNLPAVQREELCFVTGHQISFGIHKNINQKQPFYFTFVREPAKRVVSIYNYFSDWFLHDLDPDKKDNPLYQQILLIDQKRPEFIDWYQQKFLPNSHNYPNPSSVTFYQNLGFLQKGRITKKTATACFEKFSFVGLTETFSQDSAYLYHLLGVRKFFIKQNSSQQHFSLKKNSQIYAQMKKDLANEYLLYKTAVNAREKFIKQHPKYQQIVNKFQKKQRLLTPITQILFDWPENFHTTSKFFRKSLPGYEKVINLVHQLQR